MTLTVLFLATLLLALAATAAVRHVARRYGWVARPRADRWHQRATALHGGIGFYPVFLVGVVGYLLWMNPSLWRNWDALESLSPDLQLAGGLLAGSLLMFILGLWDDLAELRPATKFVGQLVAASFFIFLGGTFQLTGMPLLDLLVTYFWFVGITNAVNMLDNMDGLASGVVILSAGTLVALTLGTHGWVLQAELAVPLGLVFVAALLGFWFFNRPPASIFMGDSGSLSIGYLMAGLAVPSPLNGFLGLSTHGGVFGPIMALMIPAAVLAIPIFDTTLVTLTRKWRDQPASQGGRDHSSHRLVGLGLSESTAVWVLYTLSATGGLVALVMQQYPQHAMPLLGVFLTVLLISGAYLGRVKVQVADPDKPPPVWTPLVTHFLYKRRAAEVLFDTVIISMCYYTAYLVRFDGSLTDDTESSVVRALPLVVASCLMANFLAALYRRHWRLISVSDLPRYVMGVSGGTVLSLAVVTLVTRFEVGQSRSAYIIFGLLMFLAMMGARLSFKLLDALVYQQSGNGESGGRTPVLIYGAGRGGKLAFDEIMTQPGLKRYVVMGFVDDDPLLDGRTLCGLPVKLPGRWIQQRGEIPREVWVSSNLIPDERADLLAAHWDGRACVRRLKVVIEPQLEQAEAPSNASVPALEDDPPSTISPVISRNPS